MQVMKRTDWLTPNQRLQQSSHCSIPVTHLTKNMPSILFSFSSLPFPSVRRTPAWRTAHVTWRCRSPRPTSHPTTRRWKAPKSLSGSPAFSAPPSSRRMVKPALTLVHALTFGRFLAEAFVGCHARTLVTFEESTRAEMHALVQGSWVKDKTAAAKDGDQEANSGSMPYVYEKNSQRDKCVWVRTIQMCEEKKKLWISRTR